MKSSLLFPQRRLQLFYLFLLTYIGSAFVGYTTYKAKSPGGLFILSSRTKESAPAAAADLSTPGAFGLLPCPSKVEATELIRHFKVELPEGVSAEKFINSWVCSDTDIYSQFFSALFYIHKLNFDPPDHWDPHLKSVFPQLEKWLPKYIKSLSLDLHLADSTLAYYNPTKNSFFITERMKYISPLDFVSVFVHENRHAENNDIGHTQCIAGDLPRMDGACDEVFESQLSKMGAYNLAVYFEAGLALYGQGLNQNERDYLMASALVSLGTRFNWVPRSIAHLQDLVVILDQQNMLFAIHPLTREKILLPGLSNLEEQKINSIDFSLMDQGVMKILTQEGSVFSFNLRNIKPLLPDVLNKTKVSDISRARIPFTNSSVYPLVATFKEPLYVGIDNQSKKKVLKSYPIFKKEEGIPSDLRKIIFGFINETLFINSQNQLLRAAFFGSDANFMKDPSWQSPVGWLDGTGGALYNRLYLTDKKGELFEASIFNKRDEPSDGASVVEQFELQPKKFSTGALLKYRQGASAEYFLSTSHQMAMKFYGQDQEHVIERPLDTERDSTKIKDFAVIPLIFTREHVIAKQEPLSADFKRLCKITQGYRDPWMGLGMGINAAGELVFEQADHSGCRVFYNQDKVASFTFADEMSSKERERWESNGRHYMYYSHPVLKVTTQKGATLIYRPYEW